MENYKCFLKGYSIQQLTSFSKEIVVTRHSIIKEQLESLLSRRIVIIDGAMGTMIQRYQLDETAYRGERFKDWPCDLKGNLDLISITQPHLIAEIHRQYLEAGADIIETNTFNAQAISLSDYRMEHLAYELNLESAGIARRV